MVAFDEPWYAEMIERFSPDPKKHGQPSDGDNISRCLLASACIVAQALDNLAKVIAERSTQ